MVHFHQDCGALSPLLCGSSAHKVHPRSGHETFTAFGAIIKGGTKGRNSEGETCDCTDKPKVQKKGLVAPVKNFFGFGNKQRPDNAAIAEAFARQQFLAAVKNATIDINPNVSTFQKARDEYKVEIQKLEDAYAKYDEQLQKYGAAFAKSEQAHRESCDPLVDAHHGIVLACEKRRRKEAARFLARSRHPDCMVGRENGIDYAINPTDEATKEASIPASAIALAVMMSNSPAAGLSNSAGCTSSSAACSPRNVPQASSVRKLEPDSRRGRRAVQAIATSFL